MAQDNIEMPIATPFDLRLKDISPAGDGSLQAHMSLSRPYPLDWSLNGVSGGMFSVQFASGLIAAGLAAAAPVFAFQWTSSALVAAVRRIRIAPWSADTGFAAGLATFNVFAARSFTAQYTGGTAGNFAGNLGKLRTSMAQAAVSVMMANTGALTPGTRTLDNAPLDGWTVSAPTTANTPFAPTAVKLFEKLPGEHPLVLAQNEGFALQATVPATGDWKFTLCVEWDELPIY